MGLAVFNQFPQLTRLLACIARVAAHKETVLPFVRINLSGGRGSLTDCAVNLLASPFVSRSALNNGVSDYVDCTEHKCYGKNVACNSSL